MTWPKQIKTGGDAGWGACGGGGGGVGGGVGGRSGGGGSGCDNTHGHRLIRRNTKRNPMRYADGKIMPAMMWALVVVALGLGWWLFSDGLMQADAANDSKNAGGSAAEGWHTVGKESFDLVVRASGELEAKRSIEVKSLVEGSTTITEVVDEGTSVKEGDVLVRLADDQIREKIQQQLLSVEQARADNVAAEQELAIKENETESEIKAAEVKLALAELELAKFVNGSDPQKLADLEVALTTAERNLESAKRDVKFSYQLFEEDFISQSELEQDETDLINAENALRKAKMEKLVYAEYEKPKELKQFTSDVEQARSGLERTKRKSVSELARATANLNNRKTTLEIREKSLEKQNDQLLKTVIRAPQAGLAVYATSVGPSWRRRDPIAQGRQVRFNETLITLPDTSQMVGVIKVHESVVSKVKVGQPAAVMIDARGQDTIMSSVNLIGVTAQDGGWMNQDLREYEVRVDLPAGIDDTLKPAMRCAAVITIGRVEDEIAVPVQAVFSEGEERFCYVPAGGGKVTAQAVEIGQASEGYVVITEGLEEGDRVLLRRPKPGEVRG